MSSKASPTIVGGFVLGAITLLVLALIIFGSGSLFRERPRAVAFFQGNIQGLNIGAPVNFRGVRIGTVTDIRVDINATEVTAHIPVYIQFEPERLNVSGLSPDAERGQAILKSAIAKGLHARLASQSLVTGQLLVELSFDPTEPTELVGADPSTIEIPTTRSDLEKLKEVLAKIPLDQLAASVLRTIDDIDKLVSSPDIASILSSFVAVSENLNKLTGTTSQDLPGIVANINETLKSARKALDTAEQGLVAMHSTFRTSDRLLAGDIRQTVLTAKAALEHADRLLADAGSLVSISSAQRYDLNQILQNLSATSRSLRSFTDEIDRKPNAVILGK